MHIFNEIQSIKLHSHFTFKYPYASMYICVYILNDMMYIHQYAIDNIIIIINIFNFLKKN